MFAQHNGRVANYCHVPLVIRRVHITSTPQAIHLLALCDEVINIHLRTKKDRGQGHPSSNLRYIHGISLESMRLILIELHVYRVYNETNLILKSTR